MSKTINTYRAAKPLKFGDSYRDIGELVPEADDWPNIAVWVREGHIERSTCSEQEMQDHLKKYGSKTKKKVAVKKSTGAKKKIIKKKKGKSDGSGGHKLSEQSV